jgi:hypothetical protein
MLYYGVAYVLLNKMKTIIFVGVCTYSWIDQMCNSFLDQITARTGRNLRIQVSTGNLQHADIILVHFGSKKLGRSTSICYIYCCVFL